MVVRAATAALMLCLGVTAGAQADTSRPRPVIRGVSTGARASDSIRRAGVSDSIRPGDIEAIEVLKGAAASTFFDPIAPGRRHAMLDTLEAQRRLWQQRRPHPYVIRVLRMDDCIDVRTRPRVAGRLLRDQLVIRDTTIVRRDLVPIPAVLDQRCPLLWRRGPVRGPGPRVGRPDRRVVPVEYDECPFSSISCVRWLTLDGENSGGVPPACMSPNRDE